MSNTVEGVKAILRRVAATASGYAVAVDISTTVEVLEWYAELALPQGATATAGPNTTVTSQGQTVKLTPSAATVRPGGHAAVNAAVTRTTAPTAVRVFARTTTSAGYVAMDGVFVQHKGRLYKATEETWPGSTKTQTDPTKFSSGSGSGGGGGGGGGGQVELIVETRPDGTLARVVHRTDAGGGGGAGGGGDSGTDYQHQYQ